MNELFPDAKSVVLWLGGLVMALGGFILRGYHKDIETLKRNSVSREDVQRMHEENKDKLDAIDETVIATQVSVTKTHERIDQLYRDLMNK